MSSPLACGAAHRDFPGACMRPVGHPLPHRIYVPGAVVEWEPTELHRVRGELRAALEEIEYLKADLGVEGK